MYSPFSYAEVNLMDGTNIPSTSHNYNNLLVNYHERKMFEKLCYIFDIKESNILNGNVSNFFKYVLFSKGFCVVYEDDTYGLIFQPATIYGYNVYYQPTEVTIANPIFTGSKQLKINEDCSLIMLTPDYRGVWDIISYYSKQLASIDVAILVSIDNSKMPYIFRGKKKSIVESLKKMWDKVQSGELAVFTDNAIFDDDNNLDVLFDLDVKDRYMLDRLLADKRDLIRQFEKDIGIPTLSVEKKERTTTNEVEASYISSQTLVTMWYECLNDTMKKTNEMYGTNFTVEKRINVNQQNVIRGDAGNVTSETYNDRS